MPALALTVHTMASHKQVQDPTTLSSFAGFTIGCRLFKENEIFLRDKGHMDLTSLACLQPHTERMRTEGEKKERALQDCNF